MKMYKEGDKCILKIDGTIFNSVLTQVGRNIFQFIDEGTHNRLFEGTLGPQKNNRGLTLKFIEEYFKNQTEQIEIIDICNDKIVTFEE